MRKITLCGSSGRFSHEFKVITRLLGRLGVIAHGLSCYRDDFEEDTDLAPSVKEVLDLLHLQKVSDADIVLVIDTSFEPTPNELHINDRGTQLPSYIGFSTAREIVYASMEQRPIAFLSDLLSGHSPLEEAIGELANINPFEIPAIEHDVAVQILERALGRQTVADQQDDTKLSTLAAVLSEISVSDAGNSSFNAVTKLAEQTLNYLQIDYVPADARLAIIGSIPEAKPTAA